MKPLPKHQDKEVAVGFDKVTGYFFSQVFKDGEIIEEKEGNNADILCVMAKYCDRDNLLTETVFKLIMMDIDPAQRLEMFHSWENFTSAELYNQPTNQK